MSGLVSGLQNRVRRFESARNLMKGRLNNQPTFFVAGNYYYTKINKT